MAPNKYQQYFFVLPEDRANEELATGFQLKMNKERQMQVLEVAGGWLEVLKLFQAVHISEMERDENRLMILVIDLDGNLNRLENARTYIPDHLTERVFILSSLTRPEHLKPALGTYEEIGSKLAEDCREETDTTWSHPLLRHNSGEVARLRRHVHRVLL